MPIVEATPADTPVALTVERHAFGRDDEAALVAALLRDPAAQRRGVGRALIEHGATRLAAAGVPLLFVLGDPASYTRCGFGPALPHGLHAPYPIEPAAAWMVRALAPGVLGTVHGSMTCAASPAAPAYWRE